MAAYHVGRWGVRYAQRGFCPWKVEPESVQLAFWSTPPPPPPARAGPGGGPGVGVFAVTCGTGMKLPRVSCCGERGHARHTSGNSAPAPQPCCSVNTAWRKETIVQLFAELSASSPADQLLDSASLGLPGPHCIQPAWGLAASTVPRGTGWTAVPATSPGLHGSRRWRLAPPGLSLSTARVSSTAAACGKYWGAFGL